jgi:hypothetical protein
LADASASEGEIPVEAAFYGGCQRPAAANSLDGGYGCTPLSGGCQVGSRSMSGYHLVCIGTDGAPAPQESLNCSSLPVPVNIENRVHFCCACLD